VLITAREGLGLQLAIRPLWATLSYVTNNSAFCRRRNGSSLLLY
jgi:hypothetical protein